MKVNLFIEKYFGIFLIAGLLLGLSYPVYNDFLMSLLEPFLMVLLLLVFLKTDVAQIFQKMKNYRYMAYLVFMFMVVIPVLFFLTTDLFNKEFAIGILLLTAMPAGAASPALTDIVKGNTALSTSILITTSIIAPFTVPVLFWALNVDDLSVNPWWVFKNLAVIVFLPMLISLIGKKYFPSKIEKAGHFFTSVNIILLSLMVFAVIGSQRQVILNDFINILWKTGFLYLVFILLHVVGFLIGFKEDKKGKIATVIGAAYMNNGMAIVLAALYFEPSILVLMVLSEIPWNTLLGPFRRIIQYFDRRILFE